MNIPSSRSLVLLVLCIALPLIAGFVGAIFTLPAIPGWYAGLQKPVFTPPSWVFGPAWTILYLLMGISLWIFITEGWKSRLGKAGVVLFLVQLAANVGWSVIFFGMHLLTAAFVEVLVLFCLIAATTAVFLRISRTAGLLLVPYLCWTAFASFLTGMVWVLN
jgi:tryptophan-rich sensory protein